jgi:hypothetical protein
MKHLILASLLLSSAAFASSGTCVRGSDRKAGADLVLLAKNSRSLLDVVTIGPNQIVGCDQIKSDYCQYRDLNANGQIIVCLK